MTKLENKIKETMSSVLPITYIVFLLSITITPMPVGTILLFACSAVVPIVGMGLSSLGADMSMILMGKGISTMLSTSKKRYFMVCITFVVGFIVTIAEPDFAVLAHQVPGTSDNTLIWTVVAGVGFFLVMALLRVLFHWNLKYLLTLFYVLVFMLAYLSMDTFMAIAFDSGGVITGPITVPFLMALSIGIVNVTQEHAEKESFGIVALCSIGPILAVLLLGILYKPQGATYAPFEVAYVETNKDIIRIFLTELPHYMQEVSKALFPILYFFPLFQLISNYFSKRAIIKILVDALYTFLGLIPFLYGVNVGFIPAGYFIETQTAALSYDWILIPIGVLIGFSIIKAEPAVYVLARQAEDISSGTISTKAILYSLSIGVGISLGIAILRILNCISIMIFLTPGYFIAIMLSFFVPNMFTDIAFNSGGVANGPIIAAPLLPFAVGTYEQFEGNVLLDAFDIVAMMAMTPLLTIQILGLVMTKHRKTAARELQEDNIMEFEEVINERTEN